MELKQYISETLVEICEAVSDAKEKVRKSVGIAIAPGTIDSVAQSAPSLIEFDISILVSDTSSKEGKGSARIKVVAVDFQMGGSAGGSSKAESQQRIRFSVPVFFQAQFNER
ncbi:MAG: hypothetical protein WCY02_03675 [Parvibaculum sp.]